MIIMKYVCTVGNTVFCCCFLPGCDSGFGHALVYKMDSIGMTVFAGFLHIDGHGAFDLKNKCSDR